MVSVSSVVSPWGPMDCSPLGSSGQGILQAGIQEWVAISFSSTVLRMTENRVLKNVLRRSSRRRLRGQRAAWAPPRHPSSCRQMLTAPLLRVLEPHYTRRHAGSPASTGHPLTLTNGTWRCGAMAPVPWGPLADTPSLEWGPSPKEGKRRRVADHRGCAGIRAGTATAMLPRRLQHPAARRLPRGHQESDSGLPSVRILQRRRDHPVQD